MADEANEYYGSEKQQLGNSISNRALYANSSGKRGIRTRTDLSIDCNHDIAILGGPVARVDLRRRLPNSKSKLKKLHVALPPISDYTSPRSPHLRLVETGCGPDSASRQAGSGHRLKQLLNGLWSPTPPSSGALLSALESRGHKRDRHQTPERNQNQSQIQRRVVGLGPPKPLQMARRLDGRKAWSRSCLRLRALCQENENNLLGVQDNIMQIKQLAIPPKPLALLSPTVLNPPQESGALRYPKSVQAFRQKRSHRLLMSIRKAMLHAPTDADHSAVGTHKKNAETQCQSPSSSPTFYNKRKIIYTGKDPTGHNRGNSNQSWKYCNEETTVAGTSTKLVRKVQNKREEHYIELPSFRVIISKPLPLSQHLDT